MTTPAGTTTEWDYKHPRAQALLSENACRKIELSLIDDILAGEREFYGVSDYWNDRHDKLIALLAERDALKKDAAIGAVVWKFIDRMSDVCEVDSADRILSEFVAAVTPAIDAALLSRPWSATLAAQEKP